jgi:hypothetical protein
MTSSSGVARPSGVTIIAVVAFIEGLVLTASGISYLLNYDLPGITGFNDQASAWGTVIGGVIWLAIGYGFWIGATWARTFGVIWAAVTILLGVWLIIANLNILSAVFVPILASLLLPIVVYWYLRQDQVADYFVAATQSRLSRM